MNKGQFRILISALILLIGAFVYGGYLKWSLDLDRYCDQIEEDLKEREKEVKLFFEDKEFHNRQINNGPKLLLIQESDFTYLKKLGESNYSLSIYREDSLVFWTNNQAFPDPGEIARISPERNSKLVQLKNGFYEQISQTFRDTEGPYSILALIPIRDQFEISSDYLRPYFAAGKDIPLNLKIQQEASAYPVLGDRGTPLFYLSADGPVIHQRQLILQLWLFFIGFIVLGAFIHKYATYLKKTKGALIANITFLGAVFGVRILTIIFGFTEYFQSLTIFAPTFQTILSNSLGDLLINIFLLLWVMFFFYRHTEKRNYDHLSDKQRFWLTVLNYASITFGVIFTTFVFKTLVLQTTISYDFTNVFNLDRYSLLSIIGVIFLLAALLLYSYGIMQTIKALGFDAKKRMTILLGVMAVMWPLSNAFDLLFHPFFMLLIPIAFIFLFDLTIDHQNETFKWFVFWLIALAGFASVLLFKYNAYKDRFVRLQYAKELADLRDTLAESSFVKLNDDILLDVDLTHQTLKPFPFKVKKEDIENQINKYYSGDSYLFYNYDFKASVFDKYNEAAIENQTASYSILEEEFSRGIPVSKNNIRYVSSNPGQNKYILKSSIPIRGNQDNIAQVFLEFERNKRVASKVYSELLVDKQYKNLQNLDRYEYAVYRNRRRVDYEGKLYGPLLKLENLPPAGQNKEFIDNNRSDFLYNAPNGTVVLIGKERESVIEWISLFSYIFGLLIILSVIFTILNTIFPLVPNGPNFRGAENSSLANRIQLSIIALIVASFIIIGMVTAWFFRTNSEDYHEQRLERKTKSVLADAEHELELLVNSSDTLNDLKAIVQPLSKIHRMDVNLYNLQGKLVHSSEKDIFEKGIISPIMPSLAFQALTNSNLAQFFMENERVGQLPFKASYVPLKNKEKILGYLGLPYYDKQRELNSKVPSFMSTLINAYVFLLMLATGVAFRVAKSITQPLDKLGDTLKKVRLDGTNKPLEWKSRDELGALINEYNGMIKELEKSANALAQTEREGAWREMAKQVAHEIKNPLTPMRLSIQYLGMAYKSNPDNIKETLERVTNTMLGQIDNLTQIANEFSNFAKMPRAQNRTFILNDLIGNVFNLFKDGIEIVFHKQLGLVL